MYYFIEHIKDLSKRSYNKNTFEFSAFLNCEEQAEIKENSRYLTNYTLFGGAKGCERQIIRFGSEKDFGYCEDFPIDCICISPVNVKFSDSLTHRDILGAVMNLGIERSCTGDIFIKNSIAYIFVISSISSFICENLTKIKHTSVKCEITQTPPENIFSETQTVSVIIASMRLDCIISAVFNLSRNSVNELFRAKKVFLNSSATENNSQIPKQTDIVSVRGYGKFIVGEISGNTKKGRTVLTVHRYI